MRGGDRVGDRDRDAQHLREAHPLPGNERIEALAPDVLHHDEIVAVRRLDLVNGDDVWMIECRGGLRLLHEAAAAILVGEAVGG